MIVWRNSIPARLWALIRLGRPLFLAGGFIFYGLGAAVAAYDGYPILLLPYLLGQTAVTAAQWMTHYCNDYFDVEVDRLNRTPTRWSGGSRVLLEGLVRPRTALIAAQVLGGVALAATGGVALMSGLLPAGLMLLAIVAAWEYSAPPLRLAASGFGELAVALTVTGLTPLAGYAAATGGLSTRVALTIIPLCFLQFAMMLTVTFPDARADTIAGKGTLVVRLGGVQAARVHNAALIVAYLVLPLLVFFGLPPFVALAMALTAPVALWQAWRVSRGAWQDPARQESVAFWGIGLLVGTGLLALAAFALLTWQPGSIPSALLL